MAPETAACPALRAAFPAFARVGGDVVPARKRDSHKPLDGIDHERGALPSAPMRALVQRVTRASVTVGGEVVGAIGAGLCVLVGVTHDDKPSQAVKLAGKIWNLRVMNDADGVMNRSVSDTTGEVLIVSQFTLYGDTSGGRRPSWVAAARPEVAEPLVDLVVTELRALGATVATGRFRTDMALELVNDGPVTVSIEV